MKCSTFIATSEDGFIATLDGGVDWLTTAGNQEADMTGQEDMGMENYMTSVDCMVMGRKCMEKISSMNLEPEQWPYGDLHILVLSSTLKEPPANLKGKVEMYSGNISDLVDKLERDGYKHAYVDGGQTISSFMNLELINELIVTKAPILLGEGLRLFGKLNRTIKLTNAEAVVFPNHFIQVKYSVAY